MKRISVVYSILNTYKPRVIVNPSNSKLYQIMRNHEGIQIKNFQSQIQAEKFTYPKMIEHLQLQQKKQNKQQLLQKLGKSSNTNLIIENKKVKDQETLEQQAKKDQIITQQTDKKNKKISQKNNQILKPQQNNKDHVLEFDIEKYCSKMNKHLTQTEKKQMEQTFKWMMKSQGNLNFKKTKPLKQIIKNKHYFANFDGSFNFQKQIAGCGYIVKDEENGKIILSRAINIGAKTSNQAEIYSLLYLLLDCIENGIKHLTVRGDSELIIKGINKEYQLSHIRLKNASKIIQYFKTFFETFEILWVPREQNKEADSICSKSQSIRPFSSLPNCPNPKPQNKQFQ